MNVDCVYLTYCIRILFVPHRLDPAVLMSRKRHSYRKCHLLMCCLVHEYRYLLERKKEGRQN